jgi:hypothetical protein
MAGATTMLLRTLVLGICLVSVHGYRQNLNVSINIRTRLNRVVPLFGLDKGGRVRIGVDVAEEGWPRRPPPPWANIYLALFNVNQWYDYDLPNYANIEEPIYPCQTEDSHRCVQLCSLPSVKRFQIWGSPHKRKQNTGLQTFEFNVTERTEYTLVLLTCASAAHDGSVNFLMDVDMVNPKGQHLSVEQLPLMPLYWAFVIIYAGVLAVACYYGADSLRAQMLVRCVAVSVILKWLELLLNLLNLTAQANTGRNYLPLILAVKFANIAESGVFLGMLLVISLGWTLTRSTLTYREKQLLTGFMVLYAMFGLLHSVCSEPNYCQSFQLAFYIIKFLITFCIIVAINTNIERLRAGTIETARPFTPTQLYIKLLILHKIRLAFLAVLVFPAAVMFIEVAVLTWEQVWVGQLLTELLDLVSIFSPISVLPAPSLSTPLLCFVSVCLHTDGYDARVGIQ